MPSAVETRARLRRLALPRVEARAVGAWLLSFALVLYLGLKGGGFDTVVRSQVGLAVWWLVLVGALAGILPATRIPPRGWIALGLLATFAGWTALAISWSGSAERSVTEVGRVTMYVGVLALALAVYRRNTLRQALNGLTCAIVVIAVLAVLSRLHPAWFPTNETGVVLAAAVNRLSYPLNYWNALAALMALGMPLLLWAATESRTLVGQALASASLPVLALGVFFTISRGGVLELGVGLVIFMALARDRVPKLATLLVSGAGSAILIAAARQRRPLDDGLSTATAHHQGNELLAMAIVVCAGVALMQVGIGMAVRYGRRPRWLEFSRRRALWTVGIGLAVGVIAFVAVGGPSWLHQRWDQFKQPPPQTRITQADVIGRLQNVNGSGRYQVWQAAIKANAAHPTRGIGPGTFEFWGLRHNTIGGFVQNAHSLYLETLGELGIVGLVLLAAFLALVLGAGVHRALMAGPRSRTAIAAATAACASFCVAAAIDWVWQVAVLPVAFLLLAAVMLGGRSRRPLIRPAKTRPRGARAALVALAVPALVATAIPLAGAAALRRSQAAAAKNQLRAALADARTAQNIQPYAASPRVQEALLLEQVGSLDAAAAAARAATRNAPVDWTTWLVLSRIEAERGHAQAAVAAYRRARSLNPRSVLFAQ